MADNVLHYCGFGNIVKGVKRRKKKKASDVACRRNESVHTLLSKLDIVERKLETFNKTIRSNECYNHEACSSHGLLQKHSDRTTVKMRLPENVLVDLFKEYKSKRGQPYLEVSFKSDIEDGSNIASASNVHCASSCDSTYGYYPQENCKFTTRPLKYSSVCTNSSRSRPPYHNRKAHFSDRRPKTRQNAKQCLNLTVDDLVACNCGETLPDPIYVNDNEINRPKFVAKSKQRLNNDQRNNPPKNEKSATPTYCRCCKTCIATEYAPPKNEGSFPSSTQRSSDPPQRDRNGKSASRLQPLISVDNDNPPKKGSKTAEHKKSLDRSVHGLKDSISSDDQTKRSHIRKVDQPADSVRGSKDCSDEQKLKSCIKKADNSDCSCCKKKSSVHSGGSVSFEEQRNESCIKKVDPVKGDPADSKDKPRSPSPCGINNNNRRHSEPLKRTNGSKIDLHGNTDGKKTKPSVDSTNDKTSNKSSKLHFMNDEAEYTGEGEGSSERNVQLKSSRASTNSSVPCQVIPFPPPGDAFFKKSDASANNNDICGAISFPSSIVVDYVKLLDERRHLLTNDAEIIISNTDSLQPLAEPTSVSRSEDTNNDIELQTLNLQSDGNNDSVSQSTTKEEPQNLLKVVQKKSQVNEDAENHLINMLLSKQPFSTEEYKEQLSEQRLRYPQYLPLGEVELQLNDDHSYTTAAFNNPIKKPPAKTFLSVSQRRKSLSKVYKRPQKKSQLIQQFKDQVSEYTAHESENILASLSEVFRKKKKHSSKPLKQVTFQEDFLLGRSRSTHKEVGRSILKYNGSVLKLTDNQELLDEDINPSDDANDLLLDMIQYVNNISESPGTTNQESNDVSTMSIDIWHDTENTETNNSLNEYNILMTASMHDLIPEDKSSQNVPMTFVTNVEQSFESELLISPEASILCDKHIEHDSLLTSESSHGIHLQLSDPGSNKTDEQLNQIIWNSQFMISDSAGSGQAAVSRKTNNNQFVMTVSMNNELPGPKFKNSREITDVFESFSNLLSSSANTRNWRTCKWVEGVQKVLHRKNHCNYYRKFSKHQKRLNNFSHNMYQYSQRVKNSVFGKNRPAKYIYHYWPSNNLWHIYKRFETRTQTNKAFYKYVYSTDTEESVGTYTKMKEDTSRESTIFYRNSFNSSHVEDCASQMSSSHVNIKYKQMQKKHRESVVPSSEEPNISTKKSPLHVGTLNRDHNFNQIIDSQEVNCCKQTPTLLQRNIPKYPYKKSQHKISFGSVHTNISFWKVGKTSKPLQRSVSYYNQHVDKSRKQKDLDAALSADKIYNLKSHGFNATINNSDKMLCKNNKRKAKERKLRPNFSETSTSELTTNSFENINVEDFIDFLSTLSNNTITTLNNKRKCLKIFKKYFKHTRRQND